MIIKLVISALIQGLVWIAPASASDVSNLERIKGDVAFAVKSLINEQSGAPPSYWMFKQDGRKNPRRLKLIEVDLNTVKTRGDSRYGAWAYFWDSDDGYRLTIDFTVNLSSRAWKVAEVRLQSQRMGLDPRIPRNKPLLTVIKTQCLPHPFGQHHHGVYESSPLGFYLVKNDPPSDIPDYYLDSHGKSVGVSGFDGETSEGALATQKKFGNINFEKKICD